MHVFFAHKNIIFAKITAILTLTFQTLVSNIDWVRMGQGVRTGLGHGASPVFYRHNFLVVDYINKEIYKRNEFNFS